MIHRYLISTSLCTRVTPQVTHHTKLMKLCLLQNKILGSFGGGGAIVGPGRSGPCGSLLSIHAGCISDQKKGEWTPTSPHKKLVLGGSDGGRRCHCDPVECRTPRILLD